MSFILFSSERLTGLFSTEVVFCSSCNSSRCRLVSFDGVCTLTSTCKSPRPWPFSTGTPLFFTRNVAPGLRALGNFHDTFAIERGDGNLGAQRRLRERNGNGAIQVLAFALEERVLPGVQHDVEIAGRPAINASLALAGVQHARAFLDARRNFDRDRALSRDAAMASALGTRIDDQFARTLAGAAAARYGKEALLIPHLPAPAAGGAGDGRLARSGAAAFALVALFQSPHLYLLGDAKDSFLELESEIFAQVGAALCARTAAPALAAEHVAKSEQVAEDVVEIVEHRGVESAVAARTAGNSRVTEAVVACALLAIGKNRIRFAAFLEALFGLQDRRDCDRDGVAARACDRRS